MATQFFVGIVVAGAGFHILSEHLRDRRCMKYIILSKSSELKTIMYEAVSDNNSIAGCNIFIVTNLPSICCNN
jgi:hypothetical protein